MPTSRLVVNTTRNHLAIPLARIQSSPSPSSSDSSNPSIFDSPQISNLALRRANEHVDDELKSRKSSESMTSWDGEADGVFKPPDDFGLPSSDLIASDHQPGATDSPGPSTSTSASSASSSFDNLVGTPDLDADRMQQFHNFLFPTGNTSPASSVTSTAPSKGGITPRAEIPAPMWPHSATSPTRLRHTANVDCSEMEVDPKTESPSRAGMSNQHQGMNGGGSGSWGRRKAGSLDLHNPPSHSSAPLIPLQPSFTMGHPPPSFDFSRLPREGPFDAVNPTPRRASENTPSPTSQQRVMAQSSATGCCISAPISPPAHYPGTAANSRRCSTSSSDGKSTHSSSGRSTTSSNSDPKKTSIHPAPKWAHPPRHTNKISGRTWSFSKGEDRPDLDFDPELFEGNGADGGPDSVLEIMKGMEGRIAVKTTPGEYNIMAWLPGFSINDITISMKGDRTVQIVADLWDEEDHAQWNVLLGEDVNKSAIGATFKGSELRVTVKRKVPAPRTFRSAFSSWSAPARVPSPQVSAIASEPIAQNQPQA